MRSVLRFILTSACLAHCLAAMMLLVLPLNEAHGQVGGLSEIGAVQAIQSGERARQTRNAAKATKALEEINGDGQDEAEEEASDSAEETLKADAWDKWDDEHSINRSKSPAISWWKLLLLTIALLLWVWIGDWINRDVQHFNLDYQKWNPIVMVCGIVAGLVTLLVPIFFASYPITLLLIFGPLIAYVVVRNKAVEKHQKVFTSDWVRFQTAEILGKVGIKMSSDRQADYMKGPPVDLAAMGGEDERADHANLITARQSPGYVLVKDLVASMVKRHSEQVLLDYTSEGVTAKHHIDGVWHAGDPLERDSGDVMLAVMKQLADLNVTDRKSKQQGVFGAEFENIKYKCPISSQGVKTGERVLVALSGGAKATMKTYADIGMRDKIVAQWSEVMALDAGLVVIAAMPGGGLTTLTDVSLQETDRLMRDFVSIEDENDPELEIENVAVHTYNAKQGESPATIMPRLIRTYPNVYIARSFVNEESAKLLLDQINEDRLVITTVQAREASEALLRLLQQKVPRKELAQHISAVLCQRLIRKLCTTCRVAYEPSPDLLKKLGIPAGKVEHLYRTPKAEEADKPCKACNGIGYVGRTSMFELLIASDQVREVLVKQPKIELLRKAARNAGMRNFQEEGIVLVAKGTTSLQELQRVLKQA